MITPILKGDKFSQNRYLQNALEKEQMKNISYVCIVKSLLYALTTLDIVYAVGILDRTKAILALIIKKLQRRLCNIYKE